MSSRPSRFPAPDAPAQSLDAPRSPLRRTLAWGAAAVLLGGLAWQLWQWSQDMSGVRREAPKVPAIIPLPPPPLPPPVQEKPPEPEPPPEKPLEQESTPEPEVVKPQDEAPPSPVDDLNTPMQMDGEAQSGGDAFNIGAGTSGGMAGSGAGRVGNGSYSQYLDYALQRVLKNNSELRNLAFQLQASIWIGRAGEITRVELRRSSGDAELDAKVLDAVRQAGRLDERPPASLTLPVHVSLQGRRPG